MTKREKDYIQLQHWNRKWKNRQPAIKNPDGSFTTSMIRVRVPDKLLKRMRLTHNMQRSQV